MSPMLKLASDLVPGDLVQISRMRPGRVRRGLPIVATVLGVEPIVQTVQRKALLITFRDVEGYEVQYTYNENTTIRMISPPEGDSS